MGVLALINFPNRVGKPWSVRDSKEKEATTLLDYCIRTISISFDSTNPSNNIIWLSYTERAKTSGLTCSNGRRISQPCRILTGFCVRKEAHYGKEVAGA